MLKYRLPGKLFAFNSLQTALLVLFVSFAVFRILGTCPFPFLHLYFTNIAILLFCLFYIFRLFFISISYNLLKVDLVFFLLLAVTIMAAWQSNRIFGQPLFYGIAAQRSLLLCIGPIFLLTLLKNKIISYKTLVKVVIVLATTLLFTYFYFFLFIDPARFSDTEFVAYSSIRGFRFRFQFAPVIILLFYSLFSIKSSRLKTYYLFIVACILFYIIYYLQSRTTLLAVLVTLIIFFLKNYSIKEKLVRASLIIMGLLLLIAISLSIGSVTMLDRYAVLYGNVLNMMVGGAPDEASATVRYMEWKTALKYVEASPLLGNGFISNQWNGGWQDLLGYFYPVDIGIMGNLFVYGLIGTLIIYFLFYDSYKMAQRTASEELFYKASLYTMLFFFVCMFFSAANMRDLSTLFFLYTIIYFHRYDGAST